MPENKTFKEEFQLSEYTSILLVAYVQVKLSAVEVRLFLAKITLGSIGKNPFFIHGIGATYLETVVPNQNVQML